MKLEELYKETLFEMANLDSVDHGIDDVIIWVGLVNNRHGLRVKISNIKNTFSNEKTSHFTLTLPEFHIRDGEPASWLKPKMDDIKDFLRRNLKAIQKYEKGEINSTREFLNLIIK